MCAPQFRHRRHRLPFDVLLLCGPSGVGKSQLIFRLLRQFPFQFGRAVSHTTRPPRTKEVHGEHYYFVASAASLPPRRVCLHTPASVFAKSKTKHKYVMTRPAVARPVFEDGKIAVADVSTCSVMSISKALEDVDGLIVRRVFISPPSECESQAHLVKLSSGKDGDAAGRQKKRLSAVDALLEERLSRRRVEEDLDVELKERLRVGRSEMAYAAKNPDHFHAILQNTEIKKCFVDLCRVCGLL
eukprot:PhM_4_TR4483/c0_g1_i1/m.23069/K00942/E2.7.4.8, gmk; guanylate kinase